MTHLPLSQPVTKNGPHWGGLLAAVLVVVTLPALAFTQETARGDVLYQLHCASCHGLDGTGNGPMARMLKHAPPDLTRLSRRNGGSFPAARVRRVVEGRDVASHGERDMPVWGDAFRTRPGTRAGDDDAARIAAIVGYLDGIQNRDAQ